MDLFGKEYKIGFNMAVQIRYEDMSGKAFDLETMTTQKATMQLCYAVLETFNGKLPFTFDDMLMQLTAKETTELKNAVIAAMTEWLQVPEVMKAELEPAEGGDEKNA
jgi:hypothetical protein